MAKSLYRSENLVLAALLRELREASGVVQTEFAKKLGASQTYVSNVELASRRLDLVELRDYCSVLDIELVALIKLWEKRIPSTSKAKRGGAKRTLDSPRG